MDALFDILKPPPVFANVVIACRCGGELIDMNGVRLCKTCFDESAFIDYNHIDVPMEIAAYSYRRINHFREILAQFQAKQLTILPQSVYDLIEAHKGPLSFDVIREILKKNRLKKYYEHCYFLANRYGLEVPFISKLDEERLCGLFIAIQGLFGRHCPSARSNFLAYNFVLRKLLNIIGITKYDHLLPDLKNVNKQRIQDNTWRLISLDL